MERRADRKAVVTDSSVQVRDIDLAKGDDGREGGRVVIIALKCLVVFGQ